MVIGNPTDTEHPFDPIPLLDDPNFIALHPYAANGFDRLLAAKSPEEFDVILALLKQQADDYDTMAMAGGHTHAAALLVNVADPINLIPLGALAKVQRGIGTIKLLHNVARGAAVGAAANVIQEEALRAIDPSRPGGQLENDLIAAGFGAAFGGLVSFMAAPNFRAHQRFPSMGADDAGPRHVPNKKLDAIQDRIERLFDEVGPNGKKPRDLTGPLEESEYDLRRALEKEPEDGDSIAPLYQREDSARNIPGDTNYKLLRELQRKYEKAGKRLDIIEHPLQRDYDTLTAAERSLNHAAIELRRMARQQVGAKAAEAGDLGGSKIDEAAQRGTTIIGKALSLFTPAKVFDDSLLDQVSLGWRTFFYNGTASKAAIIDPDYSGPVPAEALKDISEALLRHAVAKVRDAYDPSRQTGAILSRNADDQVELTTLKKVKAKFQRPPITWTNANGEAKVIPGFGHFNQFVESAVEAIREQKVFADGFLQVNKQQIPPQLQQAIDAIREYNQRMLDLADEAGLLPGKRALAEARSELQTAAEILDRAQRGEPDPQPDNFPTEIPDIPGALTPFDDADVIAARAAVANAKSTADINTPERAALREKIVDELYTMEREDDEALLKLGHGGGRPKTTTVAQDRQAYIIIGPPAAGKSTIANPLSEQTRSLIIDPDMAKAKLPEFAGGTGAAAVHAESADIITPAVVARALANGDNIVLPRVGKTLSGLVNDIENLADSGYEVHLILNHLAPRKAAARGIARFKRTGRFVDPDYILNKVADAPLANYNELRTHPNVTSFAHFSNDVPPGHVPIVRERSERSPQLDFGRSRRTRGLGDAAGIQAPQADAGGQAAVAAAASDGPTAPVKTVYTSIPEEWRGQTLYEWRNGRLVADQRGPKLPGGRGRPTRTWDSRWNIDLARLPVGNPDILRKLKTITDEVWPVRRKNGKFWTTEYYLAPKKAIEQAEKLVEAKARSDFEARLRKAEARHAEALDRVIQIEKFIADSQNYFTRRYITEAVRHNKEGFKSWLKRSWHASRNIGFDENGEIVRLADHERPLIDEVRAELKIGEEFRNEGDLIARDEAVREQEMAEAQAQGKRFDPSESDADLYDRYLREVEDYFERSAESTWALIADAENAHGVEHAFTKPSPLTKRKLVIDESDPAAREFLDYDAERILASYHHTVGGRIANLTALKRARPLLLRAGIDATTPEEFLTALDKKYQEVVNILAEVDRQHGTKLTPAVAHDRERVMNRLRRRIMNIEGKGLADPTAGANALWAWGGRQLLNINYLAMLGSQTLAAINDVAALSLFSEITSVPHHVKLLTKAMIPLKAAQKRDLRLMRLGFEGEISRVQALADLDFDSPAAGVGHGNTRRITAAVGAATQQLNDLFSELTLINSWNRYIKRAAAMIAMDRFITHSRRLLRAHELMARSVPQAEALRMVGLSTFDYARLKDNGITPAKAKRILDLIRKYGTDEDGNPLSALSDEEWANYKGIALPNAGEWLAREGDAAREVYDTYLAAINAQVERAMVVTPSLTDKPLINDHWWGRALNQFQTFNMAWANQVARPMAQRPAGRQLATVLAYFGVGAIIDAIRNDLSQRRTFDETARLWFDNPLGMTYAVVNTSGLTGWFNRPLAFFDKAGVGPGAWLNNHEIARSAYQARSVWGSLSPTADLIDRVIYGGMGWASENGMQLQHWHALRRAVPFQNLIWFRLMSRFGGIDPLITENAMREHRRRTRTDEEPEP